MFLPLQMPSPSGTRHLIGCLLTTSPQRGQANCRSRLPGPPNRAKSGAHFSSADRPENRRIRQSSANAAERPALCRCVHGGKSAARFSDRRSVRKPDIFPPRARQKNAAHPCAQCGSTRPPLKSGNR